MTQKAYYTHEMLPKCDFWHRWEITGKDLEVVVVGVNFTWFWLIFTLFWVKYMSKIDGNRGFRRKNSWGIRKFGSEKARMWRSALKLRIFEQMTKKCHFFNRNLNFASGPTGFWSIHASYQGFSNFLLFKSYYMSSLGGPRANLYDQYA